MPPAVFGVPEDMAYLIDILHPGNHQLFHGEFGTGVQVNMAGYLAVDSLWLYKTNGNLIGGGQNVPTGPAFIDSSNIENVAKFAANGTR